MAVSGANTSVIKFSAASDAITGRIKIRTIRWVGATTAGHTLQITDTNGNIIFESEADGANFIDVHPMYEIFDGITVSTMSSGDFYVYRI